MSSQKNKGLGRGLGALFEEVNIQINGASEKELVNQEIKFISIHNIKPNENQPRQQFTAESIGELAESVRTHGVLQPLLVRSIEKGYEIVAGERRWRAAREAGLKEVPCLVKELDDEQNLLIALIENMQREDLNPIEEAAGIERMLNCFGMTQETAAKSLGKSRPYISNAIRLLQLPEAVKEMVIRQELSAGHARAIAGINDEARKVDIAQKCVEQGWSVREIERYIKDKENPIIKKKARPNRLRAEIRHLEEDLSRRLGTKVRISLGVKKNKIEIEYYSREELERLVELLYSE